jgi:tetratricopeptide (TPR) repeat protein
MIYILSMMSRISRIAWFSSSLALGYFVPPAIALLSTPQAVAQSPPPPANFEYPDFDFWSEQCLQLTQNRQYTDALAACEKAIALKPKRDNVDLWAGRSDALFHLARYAESLSSYAHVIQLAPKNSAAIAYQCAALFQLNRYNDAIDSCEQALQIDGNWGQNSPALALFYRGLALRKVGRLETALDSYEQALRLDPEEPSAKAERCSLLLEFRTGGNRTGCESMKEYYAKALTDDPSNVALWIQQGLTLEQMGSNAGALASYTQALHLNQQNVIALSHQCSVLNALEQYQAALESCETAQKLEQPSPISSSYPQGVATAFLWSQHSAALVGLGQSEQALASAEQAIAIRPDYALGWNSKAVSLWHLSRYQEANVAIQKAIETYTSSDALLDENFQRNYPDPPLVFDRGLTLAYFNQGRILVSLGQQNNDVSTYEAATVAYNKALATNRSSQVGGVYPADDHLLFSLYINQSSAYIQLSDGNKSSWLAEALSSTKEAIKLNPDSFIGWYHEGLIRYKQGCYEQAESAYDHANFISPNNIYILTGRGNVLLKLGRFEEAITAFNQVISIDPNSEIAQNQREEALRSQFQQQSEPKKLSNPCSTWE